MLKNSLQVVLLKDVEDAAAEKLKSKCPVNVFDIEDFGQGQNSFFWSHFYWVQNLGAKIIPGLVLF